MKINLFKNKYFLITIFIDIILVLSITFLMNYVHFLVNEDVRINLSEVVTQNKDAISSKLQLEMNNIDLNSQQLSERFINANATTDEEKQEIFKEFAIQNNEFSTIWANQEGEAVSASGHNLNIKARSYFRLGMQGISNISERTISRLTGEDIFVISSPVKVDGEIIGTIQKQYTPQQMYEICSASLFSSQGYAYIINSQGYILISSEQSKYSRESDNYYRILHLSSPEDAMKLEEDLILGKSGFMENAIDGKNVFSAYTPIDQVYDWYLISSIETSAVSPNSQVVIKLFYGILGVAVLFFTFSLLFYMTVKKKEQEKLENIAFVDTVTNGNTFTKFGLDIRYILDENPNKNYSICTFDFDNFKYINSFYGFEAGDRILREIYWLYARQLTMNERIARIHSDHFVLLLEDASEERLTELIESEYHFGEITIYLSSGLYRINHREDSVSLMVDRASLAAQKVKGSRFHRYEVYTDEFDLELTRNEQVKREVEIALVEGEIIPYFQPKVDLYTRKVVGAEALARWIKKDGTLIPPNDFIPLCEKNGLIMKIDLAIFEQTLKFIQMNLTQGIQCAPISVNFSRLHLLNNNFVQNLTGLLEKYQVPAQLLEIELTETVIFDHSDHINQFINELHERGFRISMDDFGSGYSSLHMLKDVNIDVLKIDRGFLLETANSERQKIILGAIVDMAKRLNISVVVEGVETEENLLLVKEFGCSIIQGYYFSKPLEESKFKTIYQEGKL